MGLPKFNFNILNIVNKYLKISNEIFSYICRNSTTVTGQPTNHVKYALFQLFRVEVLYIHNMTIITILCVTKSGSMDVTSWLPRFSVGERGLSLAVSHVVVFAPPFSYKFICSTSHVDHLLYHCLSYTEIIISHGCHYHISPPLFTKCLWELYPRESNAPHWILLANLSREGHVQDIASVLLSAATCYSPSPL